MAAASGRPGPDPLPREHGTVRGYRQHVKAREKACPICGLAQSEADAERYRAWRVAMRARRTG